MQTNTQQIDLFSPRRRARTSDPQTSHQAAEQSVRLTKAHEDAIVVALVTFGPGGADRIGKLCVPKLSGHQVGKRLTDLARRGAIEPTGRTVKSDSGRAQREWRVKA